MRLNVYVPDDLGERVKAALPDVNVSAVLQAALTKLIDCDHARVACADCGEPMDLSEVAGEALSRFYGDLLWALQPLVDRGGTAEGAARIAKTVAIEMCVPRADRPLPRPVRQKRAS